MKESILEFDLCKGMEPTTNAFETSKGMAFTNTTEIREAAISTMALLGHPAWLNANDKKTLNSPAISQWVFYNRAKMAVKRVTVSQFVGGVRGVIPSSKLALYGDYRYDLELEDMYDILEEMTSEQSDSEEFYVANLSSIMKLKEPSGTAHDERHDRNNEYLSNKDRIQLDIELRCEAKSETSSEANPARSTATAISQWISKWRKLLAHVRRVVNQGTAIDFWTDTLLKTCLKFLSAFKCNESLMQLMNTEIPFITNYNQLNADPISMIELLSLPQPAMENNLHLDSTQEDSLWLKLSSPFIRKLWTEDKGTSVNEKKPSRDGSFFGNLPDPTVGGTNFLRRQSHRSGKSGNSDGDIEISEIKARELLGSLLDAMDENIADTIKSKPSFPEAHGEWTKTLFPHRGHLIEQNGDKTNEFHHHAEHENPNERMGSQLRHYPVAAPVPHRHLYPPRHHVSSPQARTPLPPCRIWNTTNRFPLQVAPPIPTSDNHSVQIIRGNFQPTNLQYRTESTMLSQMPYHSLNYPPHKVLLLKSGQFSQTEQMKNAFHPNIINKTPMENQSALAFFKWRKEFPVQEKSSSWPVKNSNPTNMQQYVLPYTDKRLQRIAMLEFTKRKIHASNVMESEQDVHPYYIKSAYVIKQKRLRAGFPKHNHKLTPCQSFPTFDMKAIPCNQNFLHDRAKLHLTQQWVEYTDFEAFRGNSELYSDSKTAEAQADRPASQQYLDTKLQTLNHAGRLQKRLLRIFSAYAGKYRHSQDHGLKHGEMGIDSNRNQKPFSERYYVFNEETVSLQHSNSLQDGVKYSNFFRALHKILLKRLKKNSLKGTEMKFSYSKIRTSKVYRDDHLLRKYHMLKQIRTNLFGSSPFSEIRRHERNSLKTANSTHLKDKKNGHQKVQGESSLKEFADGYRLSKDSSQVGAESNSSKGKFKNTKKRFINPLHLRFEQKSWGEKKIENHIDAQYFNMVADSLIMDSYFKVMNEYGITDMFNASDKIDGWVHFKMTIQEVLRKAANHLMNDSSDHAFTQSRLFYNSFLNTAETNLNDFI